MPTDGSALGSTPFGLGTPASVVDPPEKPSSLVKFFDPQAGDYTYQSSDRAWKRMSKNQQRVLLTLLTLKNSSPALRGFGVGLPSKITGDITTRMKAAVREALRYMTETERVIRIRAIVISADESYRGRLGVGVEYEDLTKKKTEAVSLVL